MRTVQARESAGWICAGRSASTLSLGLVEDCRADCEAALALLPPSLTVQRVKLWQRLAACSPDTADTSLRSMEQELEQSGLQEEVRARLLHTLQNTKVEPPSSGVTAPPHLQLECPGDNQFVSRKLRVAHSEEAGRHVLAAEEISCGEVLVEERPLASVLHLAKLPSNCSYCLVAVVAGQPCPRCSQVIFCSAACRSRALASFHQYECGHLGLAPPLGPLAPALRLVTRQPLAQLLQRRGLETRPRPRHGWDYSHLPPEDAVLAAAYNMQVRDKGIDYQLQSVSFSRG